MGHPLRRAGRPRGDTRPQRGAVGGQPVKLSVVIPAHNEAESVGLTVESCVEKLEGAGIDYEIVVVDDASGDGTGDVVSALAEGYPRGKLVLNRLVNLGIRVLFQHGYGDTTNAFKAYRREVVEQLQPLLSNHFNLTVELPLKAFVRGYSFAVVPVTWTNRRYGVSKLNFQEMGSRYVFIILYVWLEHHLSRGDYRRQDAPASSPASRPHASRSTIHAGR